ncbi:ATP-binding domain-containing protein [Bradyrhizobium sp. Ash2021]|uniref:ATP-binding domain-containing protein n=1 Tax=Bradyrhizobium sp. Ash2021 TaxID=2954771 RepID=UPI002816817B|nr:ATP-binding domain-containing protein [Bradyrhizobium sp. Ash2021]WMT76305.1 ATP-binding domain-containing protein [Bradyrhizobium sp. Ash2021]
MAQISAKKPNAAESDAGGPNQREWLSNIADDTLGFLTDIADMANTKLGEARAGGAESFAVVNTLTGANAVQNISDISAEQRKQLVDLAREPAIARLVLRDEDGQETVYFIARAGTLSNERHAMASYRSPIGRMASLPVGGDQDVRTPKGTRNFEVAERAVLQPALRDNRWDSRDTVLQGGGYGPVTVTSLRELLQSAGAAETADILEALLAEGREADNVLEGLRRNAILKMGLRDQPLLDQYQDEIFRLPLDTRLVILGPPGTGKTTTLIKRLGLKLDREFLEESETALVARSHAGANGHAGSWLMFTPTELLKLYLKEAFAREGIAAPDARLQTWDDYRRELARNRFGILRAGTGSGAFVLKAGFDPLQSETIGRQIDWFEDFERWQTQAFRTELAQHAKILSGDRDQEVSRIGRRLVRTIEETDDMSPAAVITIGEVAEDVRTLTTRIKTETDLQIRTAFSVELRRDPTLLSQLIAFLATLTDAPEEPDDADIDEDEDAPPPADARNAAFEAYMRTIRAQSRVAAAGRSLAGQSRNRKIVDWLDGRMPTAEDLRALGARLQVQSSARRFANPMRRLIVGISARYRRFRRERQGEQRWYRSDGFAATDLSPLEADVVLLATLRTANAMLSNRAVAAEVSGGQHAILQSVRDVLRNQIVVDEATDFSPLQLACMANLCDPQTRSFLACGDFNQRVTNWGSRSVDELKWVFADIDVRAINITYRHSRELNDFARKIALLSGPAPETQLPAHVINDGVPPVLAVGLNERHAICAWLAQRIGEIEDLTGSLPSIAILVNEEAEVEPLAKALDATLADKNLHAVACVHGQSVGQENDVRVFDVQHIKGLEFEGVFFVGVDGLAERMPDLFDKYLYVGATRAAFYLGLTTGGPELPAKMASLSSAFVDRWPKRHG